MSALLLALLLAAAPAPSAETPAEAPAAPLPKLDPPLVDAEKVVDGLVLDLRYATENNFLKKKLYDRAVCLLRPAVAERLAEAARLLKPKGLRLKAFDCYRPFSVQEAMWAAMPRRGYVAPPSLGGSNHNRGGAVDVTLVDATGKEVEMPTDFDSFSKLAFASSPLSSPAAQKNRTTLQSAMTRAGFQITYMEWWHFDDPDALRYKTLDVPLLK